MTPPPDNSPTSYFIWLVRVALPIILFFFWYRSQPKAERTDNAYDRDELMEARNAPPDEEPPPELSNLKLMDEATLVSKGIVGDKPRPQTRREPTTSKSGKKGGGKGGGEKGGNNEAKGGGKGGEKGAKNETKAAPRATENKRENATNAAPAPPVVVDVPAQNESLLTEEERMHVESLCNFVAFAHKEQHPRVFLPDDNWPPPPPNRPPPQADAPPEADSADSAKANLEVQMVLKGVVNPKLGLKKCSGVAKALNEKLQDTNVMPTEATFCLMVEACVNARDLKAASELLMKMETSGFCPNSELLDKVMDLYSESRTDPSRMPAREGVSELPCVVKDSPAGVGNSSTGGGASSAAAAGSLSAPLSSSTISLRPGAGPKKAAAPWAAKPRSTIGGAEAGGEKPVRPSWDDLRMDEYGLDN